jgi:DNA-binding MarR family transcriptional regulator
VTRTSYLVGRVDRLLRVRLGEALEPHGLTLSEYTTLSVLASRGGLSNAQLARRALITPQSMNEVLARLESRRLVRRKAGEGRARPAELTAAGAKLLRAADWNVDAAEDAMLEGIGAADRARIKKLLEVISGNLI